MTCPDAFEHIASNAMFLIAIVALVGVAAWGFTR